MRAYPMTQYEREVQAAERDAVERRQDFDQSSRGVERIKTLEGAQTSMLQWLRRRGHEVDFSHEPMPLPAEMPQDGLLLVAVTADVYSTPQMLKAAHGKPCPYCARLMLRELKKRRPTRDHIHPRSRGGTLARGNCVIACAPCNVDKGHMTLEEFAAWLSATGDPRAVIVRGFIAHLEKTVGRVAAKE